MVIFCLPRAATASTGLRRLRPRKVYRGLVETSKCASHGRVVHKAVGTIHGQNAFVGQLLLLRCQVLKALSCA